MPMARLQLCSAPPDTPVATSCGSRAAAPRARTEPARPSRRPTISFDHVLMRGLAGVEPPADAPVAQDGHAVGDLHHLVDIMRDEDDAGAGSRDRPDQLEERSTPSRGRKGVGSSSRTSPGLPLTAHAARISSKARTMASSARSTGGEPVHALGGIDGEAEAREGGLGLGALGAPVDEGGLRRRQMRDPHVLEHGQRRRQAEALMHEAHAEAPKVARAQR